MSINDYVEAQQKNFAAIADSPHYASLTDVMDRLYRTTIDLVPALLSDLRTFLGMLSDHYAHFTPEFEGNLSWSREEKPGENVTILLEYFDTTKRTIHCAFVNLAAIHLKLLDIFNACFKEGL